MSSERPKKPEQDPVIRRLGRHPSEVARAAVQFYRELKLAPKTKGLYGEVLTLFLESLMYDSMVVELEGGVPACNVSWEDLPPGSPSGFIDFWLPRKYLGPDEVARKAPGILKKWFKWAKNRELIGKEAFVDLTDGLGAGKSRDVQRVQKATELLYRVHSPKPGAWIDGGDDKVGALDHRRQPDALVEGYMRVMEIDGARCTIEDEAGATYEVEIGVELGTMLKGGDVMNVELARFAKVWRIAGGGNVYSADSAPVF